MKAVACGAGLIWAVISIAPSRPARAQCCGDCDENGAVDVSELVTAVSHALNGCPVGGRPCCGDCDGSGAVAVNELVTAVGHALAGCPLTPTPEPACSIVFTVDSQTACSFAGRFNAGCGGILEARLVADSDHMLVGLRVTGLTVSQTDRGTLDPADWVVIEGDLATAPTSTAILGWYTQHAGNRGQLTAMHGRLELADEQRTLRIVPTQWDPVTGAAEPSFDLNGCRFADYEGGLTPPLR